ncbi:hypothetical protein V1477_000275 [Vespula maculifrons]
MLLLNPIQQFHQTAMSVLSATPRQLPHTREMPIPKDPLGIFIEPTWKARLRRLLDEAARNDGLELAPSNFPWIVKTDKTSTLLVKKVLRISAAAAFKELRHAVATIYLSRWLLLRGCWHSGKLGMFRPHNWIVFRTRPSMWEEKRGTEGEEKAMEENCKNIYSSSIYVGCHYVGTYARKCSYENFPVFNAIAFHLQLYFLKGVDIRTISEHLMSRTYLRRKNKGLIVGLEIRRTSVSSKQ